MNMMESSCIARIRSYYPGLRESEKRVADFVLSNTEAAYYSSGLDMSQKCGVSEATVVRFWKALRFNTFMEFKLALSQDLARISNAESVERLELSDTIPEMIRKVSHRARLAIQAAEELLDPQQLERTVDALVRAKTLSIFGVGSSACLAAYAKSSLSRIGIQCEASFDTHMQVMNAARLGPADMALGISYSGSTRETIYCLEVAKQAGAVTACITSFAGSPITKTADMCLLVGARESELLNVATKSHVAHMHVLDLLFTGVATRKYSEAVSNTEKIMAAITRMRVG